MKGLCRVRPNDFALSGTFFIAVLLSDSSVAQRANSVQAGAQNFASVCFLLGKDDRFGGVANSGFKSERESRLSMQLVTPFPVVR